MVRLGTGVARLKGRGDLIPDCGPAIRQSR